MSVLLELYDAVNSRALRRHIFAGTTVYVATVLALHTFIAILEWSTFSAILILQVVLFCIGFFISRYYIFENEKASESFVYDKKTQAIRYALWLLVFRVADGVCNFVLIEWAGLSYFIAPILVMCVLFVAKFFAYRRFVFSKVENQPIKDESHVEASHNTAKTGGHNEPNHQTAKT